MLKALCMTSLSLVVIASTSLALAVPLAQPPGTGIESVPNPRRTKGGWVSDTAHLLSPQSQADLNRMISELEAKNGSEVAVVTVPDTAPATSPKAFATTLFNTWKIGKRDKNNGVLVLISGNDRRVEIETGSGLGERLPDERVRQIIQQEMIPPFKQGNFDAGTVAGTRAIVQTLEQDANSPPFVNALWAIGLMGGSSFGLILLLQRLKRGKRLQSKQLPETASSLSSASGSASTFQGRSGSSPSSSSLGGDGQPRQQQSPRRRDSSAASRHSDSDNSSSSYLASSNSSSSSYSDFSSSSSSSSSFSDSSSSSSSSSSDFGGGSSSGGGGDSW
ncbi:MAG TPA: TPM domain-containing protein [Thermosynechococcaceae cyanobacterium]